MSKFGARARDPESAQPNTYQGGLQVGLASHPGRIRDRNEDASLVWYFVMAAQGQPPLPIGLFAIADGMGGHRRGEQASALVTRVAAGHVIRNVCLPLLSDEDGAGSRPPINEVLEASVHIAHEAVLRRVPEAGTTLTMALVLGDSVYLAHVGDSRAYLGQRGNLCLLTTDHSVAARLMEMGQAAAGEISSQRHILYKALGQGTTIEPDVIYHDMDPGQYLLLCCDGLWGEVSDQEIAGIIEAATDPNGACRDLVNRANELGGDDNISAILVAREWPLPR